MSRRVVVTGLGAVTPLGNNVETYWKNLLDGKSGAGPITHFDTTGFTTTIGAEVKDFDPSDIIDRKEVRRMDLFVQYSVVATDEAIKHANLDLDTVDKERVGVIIGCGIGGIGVAETQKVNLMEKGPGRVSPFLVPMMIPNASPGQIAIKYGFGGPNVAVVTACASGNNALADAARIIERGDADVIIAGGTESAMTGLSVAGFCTAKAMTTRNDDPHKASRPFDTDRDGFLIGEGAGIAVLESLEHAQARNAKILAEMGGCGLSDDAHHMTAPWDDGRGGARAMELAIKDAGLKPEDIDYINAHGTSTPLGDIGETKAIKRVFGEHAYKLVVNSSKSMIGHGLGAAGGMEFVAVVKSIEERIVHQTINIENQDPQCDLDYVKEGPRKLEVKNAITNSFGFGGHNVSLLVKRFDG